MKKRFKPLQPYGKETRFKLDLSDLITWVNTFVDHNGEYPCTTNFGELLDCVHLCKITGALLNCSQTDLDRIATLTSLNEESRNFDLARSLI
jgi:hypothetical protein